MDHVLAQEQGRTKRLLWIVSAIYGIGIWLTKPFFLMAVAFSLPFLCDPEKRSEVIPVFFLALLPHMCVAAIAVGWMFYVKGAFQKARRTIWISIASISVIAGPLLITLATLLYILSRQWVSSFLH